MLRFLSDNDMAIQDLMAEKSRLAVQETNIPFGPIRKRQVVVFYPFKGAEFVRVIVKGAPEYVLPECSQQLTQDGGAEYLDTTEN